VGTSPVALQANFLHGKKFNRMRSPVGITVIRIRARLIVSALDYDEYSHPTRSTREIDFKFYAYDVLSFFLVQKHREKMSFA